MIKFEKVPFDQFNKDILIYFHKIYLFENKYGIESYYDDKISDYIEEAYNNIQLPTRSTKSSAGYDISVPNNCNICLGKDNVPFYKLFKIYSSILYNNERTISIPTGLRAIFPDNVVLEIYDRSSNIKKGLHLANNVGIIDSDYYNANNYGHIHLAFNNWNDNVYYCDANEKLAQGIFKPFLTVSDEDEINNNRVGGFGSTDIK